MGKMKDYLYDVEIGQFEEPNRFTEEQLKQLKIEYNKLIRSRFGGWSYEDVKYGRD